MKRLSIMMFTLGDPLKKIWNMMSPLTLQWLEPSVWISFGTKLAQSGEFLHFQGLFGTVFYCPQDPPDPPPLVLGGGKRMVSYQIPSCCHITCLATSLCDCLVACCGGGGGGGGGVVGYYYTAVPASILTSLLYTHRQTGSLISSQQFIICFYFVEYVLIEV